MKRVNIYLGSIERTKKFVNTISAFSDEFEIISGKYTIDAKSILGLFTLDLLKPVTLMIHNESSINDVMTSLQPFLV